MVKRTSVVYVNYEEAQRLIPIFEHYVKEGPWKEVRADARVILSELRDVRNLDYFLGGQQIFLTEEQYGFFNDTRNAIE